MERYKRRKRQAEVERLRAELARAEATIARQDEELARALAEADALEVDLSSAFETIRRLDDDVTEARAELAQLALLDEAVRYAIDGAQAALPAGPGPGDGSPVHGEDQVPLVRSEVRRTADGGDDLIAAVLPLAARHVG